MSLLAIDPGPEKSAWVALVDGKPKAWAIEDNHVVAEMLRNRTRCAAVCEWIESYGMAVGAEVFHTCRWVGIFESEYRHGYAGVLRLMPRREVRLHLCGSMRAKDANIRAALIDRFGPGKDKAVGAKKNPGPLYGIKSHCWAALAVGLTYYDKNGG